MAYKKGSSGKGKFMDNGVGVCAYKSNPMKPAKQVSSQCGPGMNPDQMKANKLLKKAYMEEDSQRGMSGM